MPLSADFCLPLRQQRKSSGGAIGGLMPGRSAREVRGLVDTARALVFRDLRVRAQRTRAVDSAVSGMRRDERLWRLAVFDPLLEGTDFVERARTFPAAAVTHAGREKQPNAIGRLGRAAEV